MQILKEAGIDGAKEDCPANCTWIRLLLSVTEPRGDKRLRWSRGSVLAFGTQVCGSNPAEAVRFFRVKKSSARLPSEGK